MQDERVNLDKLRLNGHCDLGNFPPWIPVSTRVAANFLQVHAKTLLAWYRAGIGPTPLARTIFVGNHLYWRPGDLIVWWESQVLSPDHARDFDQVCADWKIESSYAVREAHKWPLPRAKISALALRSIIEPSPALAT